MAVAMAALAVGMLLIFVTEARGAHGRQSAVAPQAPNADRVRDYQERLRCSMSKRRSVTALAQAAAPSMDNNATVAQVGPLVAATR
jgi:hypothetical protein